jgi:Fe-S-cluster-containing dehydrogenase component
VNFLHSRQHFDFAGVEIMGNSHPAEHRLARSGGAVDGKAEVNQLIDHLLDLIFTGRILHCDDHECGSFCPGAARWKLHRGVAKI